MSLTEWLQIVAGASILVNAWFLRELYREFRKVQGEMQKTLNHHGRRLSNHAVRLTMLDNESEAGSTGA